MTRNTLLSQTILTILTLSFVFCLPISTKAIGQLTEPIEVDNVLRGQEIEDFITILNTEKVPIDAKLASGGDTEGWVEFFEPENLTLPLTSVKVDPQSRKTLTIIITVPEDAANGVYNGFISVQQSATAESDTATNTFALMEQRIDRDVTITVTDQEEINFTADFIVDTYEIMLGEPFKFRVLYDNKGNVVIKPSVQIKISQDEKIYYNAIIPYPEDLDGVKPLRSKTMPEIEVPVSSDVILGRVRATFNVLLNNETVKDHTLLFTVSEKGEQPINSLKKFKFSVKWLYGIIALVLIIAGALIYWFKRKNKKAGRQEGKKSKKNEKNGKGSKIDKKIKKNGKSRSSQGEFGIPTHTSGNKKNKTSKKKGKDSKKK